MTHPPGDDPGSDGPSPGLELDVIDSAALTVSHIAYLAASRAGDPIVLRGDTLAGSRTWKNEFR